MREEEEKERKRDTCWPTCKTVPPSFLPTKDTPTPRTPNKMTGRERDMKLKNRIFYILMHQIIKNISKNILTESYYPKKYFLNFYIWKLYFVLRLLC